MKLTTMGKKGMHGLTLDDVRAFVRETEDWPGDTYMDCYIPTEDPEKHMVAACMGLEAAENMNCPRCGTPLKGEPVNHALSRVDNSTRICSDCGNAEAVFNHFWPDQALPPLTEKIQPFAGRMA
jgi:hypothetical protein